jgi:hypothetical protein
MAPVPSSARSGTLTHLVNFLMIPLKAVELLVLIGVAGFLLLEISEVWELKSCCVIGYLWGHVGRG